MTEKEAWDLGYNKSLEYVKACCKELQEFPKPMTEKQRYMYWRGWSNGLGFE